MNMLSSTLDKEKSTVFGVSEMRGASTVILHSHGIAQLLV